MPNEGFPSRSNKVPEKKSPQAEASKKPERIKSPAEMAFKADLVRLGADITVDGVSIALTGNIPVYAFNIPQDKVQQMTAYLIRDGSYQILTGGGYFPGSGSFTREKIESPAYSEKEKSDPIFFFRVGYAEPAK
jgi:hypothetical protein